MAMEQPAAQEQQGGRAEALQEMIVSIDRGLTGVAQIIGKSMPQAGQALAKINEQYRQIISAVMDGGQAQGSAQGAPAQASPETGGRAPESFKQAM